MRLRQNLLFLILVGPFLPNCFSQEAKPAYRDPSLPVEQRAADLVKRMTLEEKVDQLAGGRRRAMATASPEFRDTRDFPGRGSAWIHGLRQHQLSASAGLGEHLGS